MRMLHDGVGRVREGLRDGAHRPAGDVDAPFAAGYHPERHASQERLLAWLAESDLSWSLEDLSPTGLTGSSRLEIRAS